MDFTYRDYEGLLQSLKSSGYNITNYRDYKNYDRCAILRHDIDYDLRKALSIAEIEHKHGIKSTYFLLLTSDFYNLLSRDSAEVIRTLKDMGHDIGLHFDEMKYNSWGGVHRDYR